MKYHILCSSHHLYQSFSGMIADVLRRRGIQCAVYHAPAGDLFDADRMLLLGDMSIVEQFDAAFRGRSGSRPPAALWFLEPLGPAELIVRKGRREYAMAHCYWPEILPSGLSFLQRLTAPHRAGSRPKQNLLVNLFRQYHAVFLKSALRKAGYSCGQLDWRDLFYITYRQLQISRHFENPWLDRIFASTPSRARVIEGLKIPVQYVPVGWHEQWGRPLKSQPRDVDVLFLGHLHKKRGRRASLLASVGDQLPRHGARLKIVTEACWGQARTELLNRTKILLDVVRLPWEIPGMRLLIGMSCGALVVSSGFRGDCRPYRQGEHFIEAPADVLTDRLLHFLNHEPDRRKITQQAQQFVTQEMTLDASLEHMENAFEHGTA